MPETHEGTQNLDQESHQTLASSCQHSETTSPPHFPCRLTYIQTSHPQSLLSILRNRNMLLAFVILLINAFRPAMLSVLLQYASIRFVWRTSRAATLISYVAVVNIIFFLLLLPRIITNLARKQVSPQTIDYTIVQISLFLLVLGAALIGLAPSIATLLPCGCSLISVRAAQLCAYTLTSCQRCSSSLLVTARASPR
jgi:hypothetical protein